MSYFTDATASRGPLGWPPIVILGPRESEMAHQTDEYCQVERIQKATALFTDLITDWCETPT